MKKMIIEISYDKISINIFNTYFSTQYLYEESKTIIIPKIFNIADRLKYIKTVVKTIVLENNIKNIDITLANTSQKNIIDIIKYEGVIEELLSSIEVK